jgi:hypothetical protein
MNRVIGTLTVTTYFVATAAGFFIVSNHNWFDAIFGTFVVGVVVGIVTFALVVGARLIRAITNRN